MVDSLTHCATLALPFNFECWEFEELFGLPKEVKKQICKAVGREHSAGRKWEVKKMRKDERPIWKKGRQAVIFIDIPVLTCCYCFVTTTSEFTCENGVCTGELWKFSPFFKIWFNFIFSRITLLMIHVGDLVYLPWVTAVLCWRKRLWDKLTAFPLFQKFFFFFFLEIFWKSQEIIPILEMC